MKTELNVMSGLPTPHPAKLKAARLKKWPSFQGFFDDVASNRIVGEWVHL